MAEKYAATITPEALKEKLTIIAGAAMEGRETATPGQKKAAAYIEAYFKKIGLQPGAPNGYQLSYPVCKDSLLSATFRINGSDAAMYNNFSINLSSIAEGNWNAKEVIFALL